MADYSRVGPVAALACGALAPLVLSLATDSLIALTVGSGLVLTLVKMTFVDGAVSTNAAEIEKSAAEHVVLTSTGNRAVRVGLGSVYLYSAVVFALRWAGPGMLPQVLQLDLAAIGKVSLIWLVCLVDGYFAGLWLSSGSDGQ